MTDFAAIFQALKTIPGEHADRLIVKANTPVSYILVTKAASPFPQHKGHSMYFAEVRLGKAYVSYHLMPLYMSPELAPEITPGLKKRMQGKTCFNFKTIPDRVLLEDLKSLTAACIRFWDGKHWL